MAKRKRDLTIEEQLARGPMDLPFLMLTLLLLGIALTRFVVATAEIDAIMFGRQIYPFSYAVSAALTLAFSAFVNFVMHFRLRKVDMVESLKSVD